MKWFRHQSDATFQSQRHWLHSMACAWGDLGGKGGYGNELESSRWLVEHLLQAEEVDRHMRSIAHQTKAARLPIHRDLAGFDFEVSPVDKVLIQKLAYLSFTDDAQNDVMVGGPGTGKTHFIDNLGYLRHDQPPQASKVLHDGRSG